MEFDEERETVMRPTWIPTWSHTPYRTALTSAAFICLLVAGPARPQAKMQPEASGYYNACVREASSSSNQIKTADHVIYTCWGSVAQSYFDYLVSADAKETVNKERTGTYIFREIPEAGRCWHKIQVADEVSVYGCAINVFKASSE
jgi:hypothetical protein